MLVVVSIANLADDSAQPPGTVADATVVSLDDGSSVPSPTTAAPGAGGEPATVVTTVDRGTAQATIVIPFTAFGRDANAPERGANAIAALADGRIVILDPVASRVQVVDASGGLSTFAELPNPWFSVLVPSPDASMILAINLGDGLAVDIISGANYELPDMVQRLSTGLDFVLDEASTLAVRNPSDQHLYSIVTLGPDGSTAAPTASRIDGLRWWNDEKNRLIVQTNDSSEPFAIDVGPNGWGGLRQAQLSDGRTVLLGVPQDAAHPVLLVIDDRTVTAVSVDPGLDSWNVAFEMAPSIAVHGTTVTIAGASPSGLTFTTIKL
ncbi:MAG: hypothetical protein Q7V57_18885 [Actinomycetota bacterium]|nr:hypothetical protein [Actinomycetota bacterium]